MISYLLTFRSVYPSVILSSTPHCGFSLGTCLVLSPIKVYTTLHTKSHMLRLYKSDPKCTTDIINCPSVFHHATVDRTRTDS